MSYTVKSERKKKISNINAYTWNLEKNGIDNPIFKAEIETYRENCMDTHREGVVVGGIGRLGLIHTQYCSFQFSPSVVSDSLKPHGMQHARSLWPSPTPGVYSNSCPFS